MNNQVAASGGQIKTEFKPIVKEEDLQGFWKLTYTVTNSEGPSAFGSCMLGPYLDPLSRKKRVLAGPDGTPLLGYNIERPETILNGNKEENIEDYLSINFLLGHPKVTVEGLNLDPKIAAKKDNNGMITLVNLDRRDTQKEDEQEVIDQVISKLSFDTGENSLTLEKMRFVLAELNLPFMDRRFISQPKSEKRALRTKLKNFVRESYENAQRFNAIINDLEHAKKIYVIKSLLGTGDLHESNGSIKFNNYPIGHNYESVVDYLRTNTELWITLQGILSKKIKD